MGRSTLRRRRGTQRTRVRSEPQRSVARRGRHGQRGVAATRRAPRRVVRSVQHARGRETGTHVGGWVRGGGLDERARGRSSAGERRAWPDRVAPRCACTPTPRQRASEGRRGSGGAPAVARRALGDAGAGGRGRRRTPPRKVATPAHTTNQRAASLTVIAGVSCVRRADARRGHPSGHSGVARQPLRGTCVVLGCVVRRAPLSAGPRSRLRAWLPARREADPRVRRGVALVRAAGLHSTRCTQRRPALTAASRRRHHSSEPARGAAGHTPARRRRRGGRHLCGAIGCA